MMFTNILNQWHIFWFRPISTEAISLFRIFFGLIALWTLLDILPQFFIWYGNSSVISQDTLRIYYYYGNPQFDLFNCIANDNLKFIYFCSLIPFAITLSLGLFIRFSASYLFMGFVSLFHHNPFIFNSGESLLRIYSLFLAFSPNYQKYSLANYFQRNQLSDTTYHLESPWAQRMIQVQLTISYWGAFCFKIAGIQWIQGTAVYYATRLPELINFPLPLLNELSFCQFLSWSTLVIEFLAWTFIWFKKFRYYILLALILLHAGIAYLFILPIFQSLFLISLLIFIEPEDIQTILKEFSNSFKTIKSKILKQTQNNNVSGSA